VRGLDPADDDTVGGLYAEQHLESAGQTTPAELFALHRGFRHGELVRVAAGCDVPEVAGRAGIVDGTSTLEGGLGVWLDDLGDSFIVAPRFVVAAGQRLPAEPVPRTCHSARVSTSGQIAGHTTYQIVDNLEQYL
jgi:hypothetical protein